MIDLDHLQAEAGDRTLVVGAVILRDGTVFLMRRAADRRLFPGCRDIPGGHVKPGETLLQALARETHEETGWQLTSVDRIALIHDWQDRREIDLVVTISGDLDAPSLETPKFSECRWVALDDTATMREGREPNDDYLPRLMQAARRRLSDSFGSVRHPDGLGFTAEEEREQYEIGMAEEAARE